jgi:hypothetical protein
MHHQIPLGTGAYLDVQRYATFDAQTYATHRHGARLGFFDLARYNKIPRSAQKFWAEIRHRPLPLIMGVLEYTLQTSQKTGEGIKYNTAISLQSAASAYHLWEKMLQFLGHMYRDRDNNVIGASHLSPTDSVIAILGNKGMRRRLSTESIPLVSLRYSHVALNQELRGKQYDGCGDDWLSKY